MPVSRTIKFFLSSTFLDFQKERDALHADVFPRLKKLCAVKGFQFQPVDLRWGVAKEVIENNQAIDFCLNEVERCISHPQPSMLILIGQRYGWVPIPSRIPHHIWQSTIQQLNSEDSALLKHWYVADENDITPHFYLRERRDFDDWPETEKKIRAVLNTIAFGTRNLPAEYLYSATEHEIRHALTNEGVNSVVFTRKFSTGTSHKHADFISECQSEKDALSRLNTFIEANDNAIRIKAQVDLNDYLNSDDHPSLSASENYSSYLREFCEEIYQRFEKTINLEIEAFETMTPLSIELAEQEKIKSKKAQTVIGREVETKSIMDFVQTETDVPFFLLYGKSGIGKSCLMANAIEQLQTNSNFTIVFRFLGNSEQSSTLTGALRSVITQLLPSKRIDQSISSDGKVVQQLITQLSGSAEAPKVILFLDGLDQTPTFESEIHELIEYLPNNLKLVLSLSNETSNTAINYYDALHHTPHKLALGPLNENHIRIVINTFLRQKGRILTSEQRLLLEKHCADKSPLYINLACKIARNWKSYKTYGAGDLGDSEQQLLKRFLHLVTHERYHKKELVNAVLGNLSASKAGLSQLELLDIVSESTELISCFNDVALSSQKLTQLPDAFFSRLYDDLKELFIEVLIDDELLLRPAHNMFAKVLKDEFYELDKNKYHQNIHNYFNTARNSKRKARELSWSLFCLKDVQRLYNFMSDPQMFGLMFEVYSDEAEILKYVNFLRSAFTKYQTSLTSKFVSGFTEASIGYSVIQFFDRVSLLGERALLHAPMTALLERDLPFQNDKIRNHYKIIQLQAKASCEKSNKLTEVIDESKTLLRELRETDTQYFELSLLICDCFQASGKRQSGIDFCENWLNSNVGTNEQNETFHGLAASLYKHENHSDKALKHYEAALSLQIKRLGVQSLSVAISQGNMAGLFGQLGKFDEALRFLKPAINKLEKILGPNERRLASFYNSLGNNELFRSVKSSGAEKYEALECARRGYEKAIDIATFWNCDKSRMVYLKNLLQLFQIQGKSEQAYKTLHKLICVQFAIGLHEDYTKVLDTLRSQLKASVPTQHYVSVEQGNLNEIQAQLGTKHEFFLRKKLELVYLYLEIEDQLQASQQFEELEHYFSGLLPAQKRNYIGYSELQNRFYFPMMIQLLDDAYNKVEQGNVEAALTLFEKAHALEKNLGLSSREGYKGKLKSLSILSAKYFNSKQFSLAFEYTKPYWDMLRTDAEFGERHPKTLQVEAILQILKLKIK